MAPEFRVNATTLGSQWNPAVAMATSGNFVVVWESQQEDGSFDVFGQRYSASGLALGNEFQVNTYTTGDQRAPAVAIASNGDFVISWQSDAQNGVYVKSYSWASGNASYLDEQRLHSYADVGPHAAPSIDIAPDGRYYVSAFASFDKDGSDWGIYAKRGEHYRYPVGFSPNVNTYRTGAQSAPSLAMDAAGNFVVAWQSELQDGSGTGIYARRYEIDMQSLGNPFLVNVYTTGMQSAPVVAMDESGDFVIAWQSDRDGSSSGIYARRYNAAGIAQFGEFRVNTYTTGAQFNPAIAMDDDGDFLITWTSEAQDAGTSGIYGQHFDAGGAAEGSEFRINTFTSGAQSAAAVAMDDDGDFVVVWQSSGQDGSGSGIYAQQFAAAPDVQQVTAGPHGLVMTAGMGLGFPTDRFLFVFKEAMATSGTGIILDPNHWRLTRNGLDVSGIISEIAQTQNATTGLYEVTVGLADHLPPGAYVLTAKDAIRSQRGLALDGDNDNVAGGDYVLPFESFAIGDQLLVNTYTTGSQRNEKMAMNANGDFVIVWTSNDQDGDQGGIYGQLFNAAGKRQGNEFRVSTSTRNNQSSAAVAMDGSGSFVVTWTSNHTHPFYYNVYAQRFDSLGNALGGEILVNTLTTSVQSTPSIAMDAVGNFVIVWSGLDGTGSGIHARRYNAAGEGMGQSFLVHSGSPYDWSDDAIAMDEQGNFVVLWRSDTFTDTGIYGRWYDSTGTPAASPFLITPQTSQSYGSPSLAMNADGTFLVGYGTTSGGNEYFLARRFAPGGLPIGSEIVVTEINGFFDEEIQFVSIENSGQFLIGWFHEAANDDSVDRFFIQRYDAEGEIRGERFQINMSSGASWVRPSIAADAAGNFVIAWHRSGGEDPNASGVYVQRFGLTSGFPRPDAGTVYTVVEGGTLHLDASSSSDPELGETQAYSWDVNGDGIFDDAEGIAPILTWEQLLTLGISDGDSTYGIRVRITDSAGNVGTSASVPMTVLNSPPVVQVNGWNYMIRGQSREYWFVPHDPSPVDQAGNFTYDIDWENDGIVDFSSVGPWWGLGIEHTFAASGTHTIRATITDKDGGVSDAALFHVSVVDWAILTDPNDNSRADLHWGGTTGIDAYAFIPGLVLTQAENTQFFGSPQITFLPSFNGKIYVYGQAGNDLIFADVINVPMVIIGGDGDDVLVGGRAGDFVDGGNGNDILFGGTLSVDGADLIQGGAGNDLIIGHHGNDTLWGGSGTDLLITGTLHFDNLPNAIYSIQAEWLSGRPLATRVDNITGIGTGPRSNERWFLQPSLTAFDDSAVDHILGEADGDWLLYDFSEDFAGDLELAVDAATDLAGY